MTHPLEHWRTDATKETRGVWIDLGGGVEWLVTRMGGQNLQALADLARLPELPPDATPTDRHLANANALASVFVKDWRGMDRPFSKAECYAELEALPDLVMHLQGVVTDRATFRPDDRAGSAGDRSVAPVVEEHGGVGRASTDGGGPGPGAGGGARSAAPLVNGAPRGGALPPGP